MQLLFFIDMMKAEEKIFNNVTQMTINIIRNKSHIIFNI